MEGRYSLLAGILCLFSFTQLFSQTPILTIESEDAAEGTELCLDITGDNFDNIFGFQFSINYDPGVLEYSSRTGQVLIGAPVNISNPDPGDIRVQWAVFGLEGFTSLDPFLLGTVCFTVLSDEETNVVFSSTPIPAEISGQAGPIAGVTYNNGLVNEGNVGIPNDVVFDVRNGQIIPGQTLCQDVTVSDFNDIASFQFTINDPLGAIVAPVIQNVHPSLTGTLNISGANTALINYTHGSTPGATLANGLTAFSICHAIPAGYTDPGSKTITEGAAGTASTSTGTMIGVDVLSGTASPPATGNDDFIFDLEDGTGAFGETVCLDLTVNGFTAVSAFQFSVNYDLSRLQFLNFDNLAYPNIQATQPSASPGQIRVNWLYPDVDNLGGTLANGSTLLTICFRVINDSETNVVFSNAPIPIEAFDTNATPFNVMTSDGVINAGNSGGPTCNDGIQNGTETGIDCGGSCAPCNPGSDNLSFGLSSGNGNVGQQVCLDLTTTNHTSIAAWQFSLNFDTDFLAYTSFTSHPDFDNNFSPLQVTNSEDGILRIVWSDQSPQFQGLSFADGTVLATFCFTVVDDGPTTVDITNTPIVITAANNMGQALPVDASGGSVNGGVTPTCNDGIQNGSETGVDCGGSCTPCVTCNDGVQNGNETGVDCGGSCSPCSTSDNLTFDIGNGAGGVGTEVCLDITTANFTDITAFQFSVNFNTSFLTYSSFTANQAFLDAFSPVNITNSPTNALRVVWVDQSIDFLGLDFNDGDVLMTICFNVVNASQTPVDITDSPISITASDNMGASQAVDAFGGIVNGSTQETCNDGILNNGETMVDCGGPNCSPCVNPPSCTDGILNNGETSIDCGGPNCAPCSDNLTFDIGNGSGGVGTEVCLDITTANFTDITAFQFSVNFNTSFLTYNSFTANQAFLDAFSPVNITNSPMNALRVVWVDQSIDFLGLDFNDGDVLMTICFNVVNASQTPVDITDSPISITASDNMGASQAVDAFGGIVNGSTQETCNDGILNNGETMVDCGGPNCSPCVNPPSCTDGILNNGETSIDCGGPNCAPCSDNLTFDIGNGSGGVGTEVCLDITTANFTDITAFQFSVNFNTSFLTYSSFTANQAFLDAFSPVNITNSPTNALRVVWVDQSIDFLGLDFNDGDVLMTICFNVVNASQTPVDITDSPISITASDNMGASQIVDVFGGIVNGSTQETCNDGILNNGETMVDCGGPNCAPCNTCSNGVQDGDETGIDCGGSCSPCVDPPSCTDGIMNGNETGVDCGGPDCTPCSTNLTFDVGNGNGGVGTEVCLDITTANFADITAFQFSVNFNTSFLTYNSFTANQAFLDAFSPVNITNSPANALRVVWVDQSIDFQGLTFNDGDVLMTICFNVVNASQTPVDITDSPISITASDNMGASQTVDVFGGIVNGTAQETCNDGILNNGETMIDCGGPNCAPCNTCSNGVQDGDETGVDCGGSCGPCVETCDDGILNNGEAMVDCGGPNCAPCSDNLTFDIGDGNGGVGTEVCLDITTANFTDITAFQFSVNFNTSFLTYNSFTANQAFLDAFSPVNITNSPANALRVVWVDQSIDFQGLTFNDGDVLMTICFNVVNASQTPVDITDSPISITASDNMGASQIVDVFGGIVNGSTQETCDDGIMNGQETGIDCGGPDCPDCPTCDDGIMNGEETGIDCGGPDCPDCETCDDGIQNNGETGVDCGGPNCAACPPDATVTFAVGNGAGLVGEQVCLNINAFDFTDITDFQYSINYDPTKLQFAMVLPHGNLAGLVANSTTPGQITISWSGGPVTLANGTTSLEVCFSVIEACSTPVEITDIPLVASASNSMGSVMVNNSGGIINNGIPCVGQPDNLVFDIGDSDGIIQVGEETCLDIIVENFDALTQLSFSVTYDAAVLTYNNATNFGLAGLTDANITNPSAGVLSFDWTSGSPSGVSLPDGSVMVSICFTVIEVQETIVNPAAEPTTILAGNANGQNVGVIAFRGFVNVGSPPPGLTFIIGSTNGMTGETVCLPVTVYDFVEISSFQFGITYDTSLFTFINANVPSCPLNGGPIFDCIPGLFPTFITNPNPGDVRVAWPSPDGTEKTIADGSEVFELCFLIRTDIEPEQEGECGFISFTADNIAVEFFGPNGQVPATLINGGINCSDAPAIVDADVQGPSCEGETNGSISLTIAGGANLVYSWTPNVGDGPTVTDLPPGVYTVVVTNPNTDESTSATYTVSSPPPFSIIPVNVQDVRCNGESNGSITIATNGGTPPYTIDWSGNLPDGVLQQNNLTEGFYSVTVTDDNGCSRELIDIEIEEPGILIAAIGSIDSISTIENGAITLVVTGGTPLYTYQWSGPGSFSATTRDIADLTEVGTYCVTVTDSRSCVREQCFLVPESMLVFELCTDNHVITQGCAGENNGAIDLCVQGCSEPEFEWTDSEGMVIANTEDVSGLDPGTYQVVVSCGLETRQTTFTLFAPSLIDPSAVITPAIGGDNGAIDLTVVGGAGPYTYIWTNAAGDTISTNQDINNLAVGEYCVLITDQTDCGLEECFTVTAAALAVVTVTGVPALCADSINGSAEVMLVNGTGPFTIVAQPGNFMSTSATNPISIDLPAGTFTLMITDAQGSQVDTMVTITAPAAITLASSSIVSDTEDAECVGGITLNIEGGTPMYGVVWSQQGLEGPQVSELCAGTYSATITDANGCQQVVTDLNVGELTEEAMASEVACPGDATGSIDLTVDGGVSPYSFEWTSAGSTDVIAETEDLTNVEAGDYTVMITDSTGASLVRTYTVTSANGFFVTASVTTNFNGFGVSCTGATDAQLVAEVSGTGTYSYEWRRNGGLISTDSVLNNAPAGMYDLRVTSTDGCIVEEFLEVTTPGPLEIIANITDASCEDARDGRIELMVSGGAGGYEYFWQDGRTTAAIPFLRPDRYSVEVTDVNNCAVQGTFTVNAPEVLFAFAGSTDASDGCNGTIDVTASGGNGTYAYFWPQLLGQTGPNANGLCPGDYTIEVTDSTNCQTFLVEVTVRDRRFPCLEERNIITPNGDGLNEAFILFCTDGVNFNDNVLEIYNRWGQLVYKTNNYDCSQDGGANCFEGQNNDGADLPEGPYYYILDYANPSGDRLQKRGSLTILRE